jgi:hypothetical protein
MPALRDPRGGDDGRIAALQAEIARLRERITALESEGRRQAGQMTGEWVINRPMSHTGELLGFFGVPMQARAARPKTLDEVVAVLTGFGLTR